MQLKRIEGVPGRSAVVQPLVAVGGECADEHNSGHRRCGNNGSPPKLRGTGTCDGGHLGKGWLQTEPRRQVQLRMNYIRTEALLPAIEGLGSEIILRIRKGIQNPTAVGSTMVVTGLRQFQSLEPDALEVMDFPLDFGHLLRSLLADLGAGSGDHPQFQQLADLLQREAELLGTLDESDVRDVLRRVFPVAGGRAGWLREQAAFLVIT